MAVVKYIEDNRKGQFTEDDSKWYAVCAEHGMLIGVSTKREAQQVKTDEFCSDCQEAN